MSDSESVVSSIFENVPSVNDLSDTETTEPTDTHSPQRDRLSLYEYVSVTINIEATLARDFHWHSLYNHGVGKIFRLDSEDAAERLSRLIDEFLSYYDIPTARRIEHHSNYENIQYPRFVPSKWIMLVFRLFPFRQFEFLPVRAPASEPMLVSSPASDHLMFAAINPPVACRQNNHPILRSNPPFFIEPGLLQYLPSTYTFKVAAITDGPQTLLQPDSIQLLEEIHLVAKETAIKNFIARREKDQTQSQELLDRSPQSRRRMSFLKEWDVVVNVDRMIETSSPPTDVSLNEEINRVLRISEYFILWCCKD